MITNSQEFKTAASIIKQLKNKPTDNELLELYGLYKQATCGDINIPSPWFSVSEAGMKWTAWNSKKGLSTYDSEVTYIKKVNVLIKQYGLNK
jgi:diazepam-binding inhibitor (GABA receptor modulating acyl-CoA-binding protein)